MKNKYTFWLILLAVLSSRIAFSQTNPTNMVGAWQQKDTVGGKVVQFRNSSTSLGITKVVTPATLRDSLKNYAQIQDGLISGGEATLGVGSVTIDTAIYRINKVQYTSFNTVFSGIANSPSGTQYYLVVYGEIGGTLDTISGARDTIAVIPSIPVNTVKVNTILVGDGGVESTTPDLSGFAKLVGGNTFNGQQRIDVGSPAEQALKTKGQIESYGYRFYFRNRDIFSELTSDFVIRTASGDNEFLHFYKGTGDRDDLTWSKTTGIFNFKQRPTFNGVNLVDENQLNTKQDLLNETNFGQFMDVDLATKLTPSSGDFLLGRDIITNEAVEIPFSTVQPSLGFTPENVANKENSVINTDATKYPTVNLLNTGLGTRQPLDATLTALAAYNTNGILTQTAADTFTGRTITGTTDQVNVTNGNGVSGNPTLSLPQSIATTSSPQFARLGLGLAASSNHYLTTAANTSTIGSWLWTPSSTDYTGTVSGTFYNNANELKFYDGTISGINRLIKLRNNESFSGIGSSGLISSNTGDVSALPLVDRLTAGEVQTSTNRTLSLIDFGSNGSLTVYCTTSGGDVTITLPSPTDMRYLEVTIIKVTAGNNVIISGSANINGSASISESAQYKSYTLVSNGTQYYIKGERP